MEILDIIDFDKLYQWKTKPRMTYTTMSRNNGASEKGNLVGELPYTQVLETWDTGLKAIDCSRSLALQRPSSYLNQGDIQITAGKIWWKGEWWDLPGVASWLTSGTTMRVPINSHRSPGWASSTASARRRISILSTIEGIEKTYLRGTLPRKTSACVSCTRTFWKSTNFDWFVNNSNLTRLAHWGLKQTLGWVYLNCCSTPRIIVPQSSHLKVPNVSSGWTGCERTTWARIFTSLPSWWALSSRNLTGVKA